MCTVFCECKYHIQCIHRGVLFIILILYPILNYYQFFIPNHLNATRFISGWGLFFQNLFYFYFAISVSIFKFNNNLIIIFLRLFLLFDKLISFMPIWYQISIQLNQFRAFKCSFIWMFLMQHLQSIASESNQWHNNRGKAIKILK